MVTPGPQLLKMVAVAFAFLGVFLGGEVTKNHTKTTVFLAENSQAKAAADAWAAEASEAAKRAKGKVEHGEWEISPDDETGEIFPEILLMETVCIKLTVNNEINYLSTG